MPLFLFLSVAVVGVMITQRKLREFMSSVADCNSNICYLLDDAGFFLLSSDENDDLQLMVIYVIIQLKSVCRCSQFLLNRLGRYLKLFISTVIPFSLTIVSQFGLSIFV